MKIKFPSLHSLVSADKKMDFNNHKKLIHVVKGHAIVSNDFVTIVNLRDYIKRECALTDESDFNDLDELMIWLENKSFTKDFWKELTTECFVSLISENDQIKVEHPEFSNILAYETIAPDSTEFLGWISTNLVKEKVISNDRIAVPAKYLQLLSSTFKKELSSQKFIFEFTGKDGVMRFSGVSKDYIFGIIPLSYDEANEFTNFMNALNFGRETASYVIKK